MEINGIGGVINTYKAQRPGAVRKSGSSAASKNIDRVEFGFETALASAKKGIAAAVKADATAQELKDARSAMDSVTSEELASYILLG